MGDIVRLAKGKRLLACRFNCVSGTVGFKISIN